MYCFGYTAKRWSGSASPNGCSRSPGCDCANSAGKLTLRAVSSRPVLCLPLSMMLHRPLGGGVRFSRELQSLNAESYSARRACFLGPS